MVVYPAFDMVYLFAELTFGGILASGIGLAALFFFIGMIGKESYITNVIITLSFLLTFSIGFVGGFGLMLFSLVAIVYAFRGVTTFINSGQ